MSPNDPLPDNPLALKHALIECHLQLAERDTQLAECNIQLAEQAACMDRLREESAAQIQSQLDAAVKSAVEEAVRKAIKETTAYFMRRFYGPRGERFDPRQLLLFGLQVEEMPLDRASIAEESGEELTTRRAAKKHKHGRNALPDHLPRIEIIHDLTDTEKPCPCCGEVRKRIGEEVSEQLEYLPASFKVLKHVRVKYACGKCEHDGYNPQIVAAAKPPQPIEKGLPGPGLLAYVITSKLGDHLPLYRPS